MSSHTASRTGVTRENSDPTSSTQPATGLPSWATSCLNCGTALSGPFCSKCGQRAVAPHPTIRELAGDAYAELMGWDGKFAQTTRLLLRSPGSLTQSLLEGRRAQYISPVRLYLLCSLIYFIIAAAAPLDIEMEYDLGIGVGASESPQSPGEAALSRALTKGSASLTPQEKQLVEDEIALQPRIFRPMLRAMAADYRGVSRRAAEVMPRALFILIPALGAILALFFRGRHYLSHLYFAIHLQAFVFLVLSLVSLAQYTKSLPVFAVAQIASTLWIVGYAVVALRRVYGGSWLVTGFKSVGVALLYVVLWSATSLAVTLWSSLPG